MVTIWKHSNVSGMFATWIGAVCANLAVVLLTALANRCWSLELMFGDWLMLWLQLTILFSKAYSIHLHYAFTSQTMLGKAKHLIESFWVKPSNWSKLTKHCMTVRSEAAVGKSVRSRKLCANVICPNVWRHTQKKLLRLSADQQSWLGRHFFWLITCIERTVPSTFTNHFESKRTCWTIISNSKL